MCVVTFRCGDLILKDLQLGAAHRGQQKKQQHQQHQLGSWRMTFHTTMLIGSILRARSREQIPQSVPRNTIRVWALAAAYV